LKKNIEKKSSHETETASQKSSVICEPDFTPPKEHLYLLFLSPELERLLPNSH
jgi:hypothetical protein